MEKTIERTLVLLKPDAVKRGLMGEIVSRFERTGMKIVALRLCWVKAEKAGEHYGEDIVQRRGEKVRNFLIGYITSGPVLAMVIEGVSAVENVRLMCGSTEPRAALPGTIRGDYSHVSYAHANALDKAVENVIHASATTEEAEREIYLWFNQDEIFEYKTVHEAHTF